MIEKNVDELVYHQSHSSVNMELWKFENEMSLLGTKVH